MHKVPREALPEPRERRTFPFGGTPLPSPAASAVSSSDSRWQTTKKGEKPEIPYVLTAAGVEIIGEPGPASQSTLVAGIIGESSPETTLTDRSKRPMLSNSVSSKSAVPRIMRQNHKHHIYNAYNNFGHWNVANNMDPLLVAENVPKWSTSSNNYGSHYYHPHQRFARGFKNRMPVWQYDDSRRFCYYPEEKEQGKRLY